MTFPNTGWHIINLWRGRPLLTHEDYREVKLNEPLTVAPPIQAGSHGLHYTDSIFGSIKERYGDVEAGWLICYVKADGLKSFHPFSRTVAAAEKRTVLNWKQGGPIIQELAKRLSIPSNVFDFDVYNSKGSRSWLEAREHLMRVFESDDEHAVCNVILGWHAMRDAAFLELGSEAKEAVSERINRIMLGLWSAAPSWGT